MANINTPNTGPSALPPELTKEVEAALESIDLAALGIRFNNDIQGKKLDTTEFNSWLRAPWNAYEYLNGKIMPTKENEAFLFHLQTWNHVADGIEDPLEREEAFKAWEQKNPAAARLARETILKIHALLHEEMLIQQETAKHIKIERGGNMLEDAMMKTKEYIVDEFPDHPATSAAVVATGYMLYQLVKGKKLWSMVKWGAGLGVLYAFLKDKFDFKPVEGLAGVAENLGGEKVADVLRETSDTVKRMFYSPEGEKAIDEYARTEIGIEDEYERYYFSALMMESPKDFLTWYNAVNAWRTSRDGPPPPLPDTIKQELNDMAARGVLPTKFFDLNAVAQTEHLLQVSDKFIGKIGEYAGLSDAGETIAYLNDRYVTGDFFEKIYQDWLIAWKSEHPDNDGAFKRICDETKADVDGFKERVIQAQDEFNFLNVLRIELPQGKAQELKVFNGPGKSLNDLKNGLQYSADRVLEWTKLAGEKSYEYLTVDVPEAAKILYNNDVLPMLNSVSRKVNYEDFEQAMLDLKEQVKFALIDDFGVVKFMKNTETWQALKEAGFAFGRFTKEGFVMGKDKVLEMWEHLEKYSSIFKAEMQKKDQSDTAPEFPTSSVKPEPVQMPTSSVKPEPVQMPKSSIETHDQAMPATSVKTAPLQMPTENNAPGMPAEGAPKMPIQDKKRIREDLGSRQ